jgi:hypothetical protein
VISNRKSAYNIEFAHVYLTDEGLTREALESAESAQRHLHELDSFGNDNCTALCVLVDDYLPGGPERTPIGRMCEYLLELSPRPTHIVRESSLTGVADDVIRQLGTERVIRNAEGINLEAFSSDIALCRDELWMTDSMAALLGSLADDSGGIPSRATTDIQDTIVLTRSLENQEVQYSCAILTAAWHLCRLGIYELEPEGILHADSDVPFAAEKALTILPTRYISLESAALMIIGSLRGKRYKKARRRMEYRFYATYQDPNTRRADGEIGDQDDSR